MADTAIFANDPFPFSLNQSWQLRPVQEFGHGFYPRDDAGWLPTCVPGHWQQHPELELYAGKMVYRCRFTRPNAQKLPGERLWLRVNGAFYWSQPYFNGVDLQRHEGYFIPYESEITDFIEDQNELLIEVECPEERHKSNKRLITGIFSHWDAMDRLANPGGIWLPVEVQRSGSVRLGTVRCHTETLSEHFAQLRFQVKLDSRAATQATLRWTIRPQTFAGAVQVQEQRRTLRAGQQELSGFLKLRDPQLWWTHDLGEPHLYTVELEIVLDEHVSDRTSFSFGVRRFELRDWIPYLNGVRFLIKGNNYGPGDTRIATMTPQRCEEDLALARDCHMNLLRVHAHVDHPAFYEAANRAGILIWQDMPLQWLYDQSILPEAKRQTQAMVHLLYNHPSVVIWCMHNESVYTVDTSDERLITRLRTYNSALGFNWSRDVFDKQLKQVAQQEDHLRPVIRSSGEATIPRYREGTDTHLYFGWYLSYGTLQDAEVMRKRFPANMRFVTEFGAQSFPNLESSLRFIDPDIAKLDLDILQTRHHFQPHILSHWVNWQSAQSLAELIDMTQDYQIFINRYYIDRLRVAKYRPTGGIVPFMFHDSNPAVQWSVIDYWRVPKRSYAALKLAFSPQYACAIFDPRSFRVGEAVTIVLHAVNDAQRVVRHATLDAWLCDADGKEIAHVSHRLHMPADCLAFEVDRLRLTPPRPGRYTLALALRGDDCTTVEQSYSITVTS